MILLDTNVISEQFRAVPSETVIGWLSRQPLETLYLASMTVAELRAGVALMPVGKRRTVLSDSIEQQVLPVFVGRVLPFDMALAHVPMPMCWQPLARPAAASRRLMPS